MITYRQDRISQTITEDEAQISTNHQNLSYQTIKINALGLSASHIPLYVRTKVIFFSNEIFNNFLQLLIYFPSLWLLSRTHKHTLIEYYG